MYIPSSFAERDLPTLFAFMDARPLGTFITNTPSLGLYATHLPLVLNREGGPMGVLDGHLARANPHARDLPNEMNDVLVVFTGPDAYITPDWYATKRETGRAVPTWNYIAVHAYANLRVRNDEPFLRTHLEALTQRSEAIRQTSWKTSDAPAEFIDSQMKAIIGIELTITRLEGKWKMSQNRSAADIDGVIAGLGASNIGHDREVGEIVKARRPQA